MIKFECHTTAATSGRQIYFWQFFREMEGTEWPILKNPTAATIVVDGYPIHDYLAIVRDQMEMLKNIISQQGLKIGELTAREQERKKSLDDLSAFNQTITQRLNSVESQSVLSSRSMDELILNHSKLKEFVDQPPHDKEVDLRLDIVEKKLASFYGDETNILGRVNLEICFLVI
jgi:hypothetical protein